MLKAPARTPSDIPTEEHYAVIVFKKTSVYHEADERSRTNPGHGYPAYSEEVSSHEYLVFNDVSELNAWLTDRMVSRYSTDKTNFQVIKASPLNVTFTAEATVKA